MDVWLSICRAVAKPLATVQPEAVRIPARGADCGVYAPDLPLPSPEAFGTLFGEPLAAQVRAQSGWLLLTFTGAFCDACVERVCEALPLPKSDGGSLALNRMLALSRQGGAGCPDVPAVRRAFFMLLGAAAGRVSPAEAARAFTRMLLPLPCMQRQRVRRLCGRMAGASARLYALTLNARIRP